MHWKESLYMNQQKEYPGWRKASRKSVRDCGQVMDRAQCQRKERKILETHENSYAKCLGTTEDGSRTGGGHRRDLT